MVRAVEDQETVDAEAPAPTSKAKPKASTKPKGKPAKAKPAPKGKPAPKAKPAPKGKAKPKGKPIEKDVFGLRQGSIKSKAAALYASKGGATLSEVKDEVGSIQLNVLTELKERDFKIKEVKEAGEGKRKVTRYFLSAKK